MHVLDSCHWFVECSSTDTIVVMPTRVQKLLDGCCIRIRQSSSVATCKSNLNYASTFMMLVHINPAADWIALGRGTQTANA